MLNLAPCRLDLVKRKVLKSKTLLEFTRNDWKENNWEVVRNLGTPSIMIYNNTGCNIAPGSTRKYNITHPNSNPIRTLWSVTSNEALPLVEIVGNSCNAVEYGQL